MINRTSANMNVGEILKKLVNSLLNAVAVLLLCTSIFGCPDYPLEDEWIYMPGGSFNMGDDNGLDDTRPVHEVMIPSFEILKTEVTVENYKRCVDEGTCTLPPSTEGSNYYVSERSAHPVNYIGWLHANKFCMWIGGRLPSESEWEYAARGGGMEYRYPWGNNDMPSCVYAVMDDGEQGCGNNSTWDVCSKPKGNTAQGLCDMVGNVNEWVQDWYHDSYNGAPSDGSAWEDPPTSLRISRGGSYISTDAEKLTTTHREDLIQSYLYPGIGFRCARDAD